MAITAPKTISVNGTLIIKSKADVKAAIFSGTAEENTIKINNAVDLSPILSFDNIQHIEVAAGKTVTIKASQLQEIADYALNNGGTWDLKGLSEENPGKLIIKLDADDQIQLDLDGDNQSPFFGLEVSYVGNSGDEGMAGTDADEAFSGLAGDDDISGNDGDDTIDGGLGNDWLAGDAGEDSINGGAGDDTIDGGDDEDFINGGAGHDAINGGEDNDTLLGAAGNDEINGDAGDDSIVGGNGNDELDGGDDNDILLGGNGTDSLEGGDGDDTLSGDLNNDTLYGQAGNDSLLGGSGKDILDGGDDDDTLDGGIGDDTINGGSGDDLIRVSKGNDFLNGDAGGDTFVVNTTSVGDVTIDGGTTDVVNGDREVNITYYTGTSISTVLSTLGDDNGVDTVQFNKSGDFTNLEFTQIEEVRVASGVSIKLDADMLTEAFESLDINGIQPGVHFYGVSGGATETVTVDVQYDSAFSFTGNGVTTVYERGEFQLDDASIGDLFHDIALVTDFDSNSQATSNGRATYGRADGSNSSEKILGNKGVDNIDGRLGNDTIIAGTGNDLLKGQGGADSVDGGAGNDFFLISGFQSDVAGAYGKADDGNAEWVDGDVIIGGSGTDTLRITTGGSSVQNSTITLNDTNFKSMEVVQVGGLITRMTAENSDLQLVNDHYYFNAGQTISTSTSTLTDSNLNNGVTTAGTADVVTKDVDLVLVDASGVTLNGLKFEGNGNKQTFIGTTQADTFIGNGGNDTLTGGAGADIFQFGKIHTMTANNTTNSYDDVASNLAGVDTIKDFTSGTDKIHLDNDFFAAFTSTGTIAAGSFISGAGTIAAVGADDYLIYNTTDGALYYDADGSGSGSTAVQIASLTDGSTIATLASTDFVII